MNNHNSNLDEFPSPGGSSGHSASSSPSASSSSNASSSSSQSSSSSSSSNEAGASNCYLPSGGYQNRKKKNIVNPNALTEDMNYYVTHLRDKEIPNSTKLNTIGITSDDLQNKTELNLLCPLTLEIPDIPVHIPRINPFDVFELSALTTQSKPDSEGLRAYPGRHDQYFTLADICRADFINMFVDAHYKARMCRAETYADKPDKLSKLIYHYEGHLKEKEIANNVKLSQIGMTSADLQKETGLNLLCRLSSKIPNVPVHIPTIDPSEIFELNDLVYNIQSDANGRRAYPNRENTYFTLSDICPANFVNKFVNGVYKAKMKQQRYSQKCK